MGSNTEALNAPRVILPASSQGLHGQRETHSVSRTRHDFDTDPLFAFVNGPSHLQSEGTRTFIRTHAMRHYLRQREGRGNPARKPNNNDIGLKQKFRLTNSTLEPTKPSKRRPRSFDARAGSAQSNRRTLWEGDATEVNRNLAPGILARAISDHPAPADLLKDTLGFYGDTGYGIGESNYEIEREEEPWMGNGDVQVWQHGAQYVWEAIALDVPRDMATLACSRLDPFGTLPVVLDPSTEVLVDRFQSAFSTSWCPISAGSGWFRFAITDAALFHATLLHWAAHKLNATKNPKRDSIEIMTHKFQALRLINERLSDPMQQVSDETVAAVACLANVETAFGSLEASKVHMAGLQNMIRLRGGLFHLGFDGLLQRLIHWIDAGNASLLDAPLRFPAFTPARVTVTTDGINAHPIPPLPSKPSGDSSLLLRLSSPTTTPRFLTKDVLSTFTEIETITRFLTSNDRAQMTESARRDLSDRFSLLERKLLTFSVASESTTTSRPSPPLSSSFDYAEQAKADENDDCLSKSCSLAALLYVHIALRGVSQTSVVIRRLATRLRNSLSRSQSRTTHDFFGDWLGAEHVLTWVLVTGALAAAEDRGPRTWFVDTLAGLRTAMGAWAWDGMRTWLGVNFFLEGADAQKVGKVWIEVDGVDVDALSSGPGIILPGMTGMGREI